MPKRKTTQEWIEDAIKIWGDMYDYSQVEYKNSKRPVTVICPKHGPWSCNSGNHINKSNHRGCPKCGRERQISKAKKDFNDFVRDARSVHGDKYEYDPTGYKNARHKIRIICPEHGPFMQIPDAHYRRGQGCPDCGQKAVTQQQLLSIDELNKRLKDRSDCSVTVIPETFHGINSYADFICSQHGRYSRLVNSVLTSNPCLLCAKEDGAYRKHSDESFKDIIKAKFGDLYKINDFKYKGNDTPITLVCKKHGPFTLQAHGIHKSPGCPRCAYKASMDARRKGQIEKFISTLQERYEQWLENAREVHGKKYDYSLVDYKSARRKVDIICPLHGVFQVTPESHLTSQCIKCFHDELQGLYSEKYFQRFPDRKNIPAILYYLKFQQGDLEFYKVGITTETIAKRFSKLGNTDITYKVLGKRKTKLYDAFSIEQKIQESHGDKHRYIPKLIGFTNRKLRIGPTECFNIELDKNTCKQYFAS